MIRKDEAPPNDRGSSPAALIEEGARLSQYRCTQDDVPIESVSGLDIEESLRLLDEIWPRDKDHDQQFPRQFGRFAILGELGRGGFGVVYLAEDPLLGRKVALKLPRVEVLSGTEGWRRFLREARAASRLDHPNLIPLLDAGTVGPVGYIVSAFVPGPSLEQWLRHNRDECSARWAARLVGALARAIEHAHQKDVLHRDLKPANVLLHATECEGDAPDRRTWEKGRVESWTPRICDFGLAKLREIGTDDTKSRIGCGSPPYMAPEQAEARQDELGPATDVYGLGAILYELLTGRPPFTGRSDLETLRKVVADEPVAPRNRRPGVPRDLDTICLKCLSKRPGSRYPSASALAEELERYLEGRPIQARPLSIWARGWKWACRKPALAALAMATLFVVVAGLFGLLRYQATLRRHNHDLFQLNKDLQLEKQRAEQLTLEKTAQHQRDSQVSRRLQAVHQIALAKRAMASRDFERALRLLDDAEPIVVGADDRGFAWSFLHHSIRDHLEVSRNHQELLSALSVSPDGRTLASADWDGAIWLWDLPSGNSRRLSGPWHPDIQHLVFSPDSRSLALATFTLGEIFLGDVPSARLRGKLATTGTAGSSSLLFTRGGKRLSAVREGPGWNSLPYESYDVTPTTGELPLANPGDCAVIAAELTDERLQLLVDILDDARPKHLSSLDELKRSWADRSPRGVARTRDKSMVVIGLGDGTFAVYRADYCLRLMLARLHRQDTAIVVFDPLSNFGGPRPREREQIERLAGRLVGNSSGPRRESPMIVRQRIFEPAAFSPDGRYLAIWQEAADRLRIVDLATGLDSSTFDLGPIKALRAMAFTPDGASLAFGAMDHKVWLWHLNAPPNPQVLPGHSPKEAWSVAFSPDGRSLASGGDDHLIRLWDVQTGRETAILASHNALVTSVAFAPDGQTLASGSFDLEKPVILWDLTTRLPKFLLEGHANRVRGVAFSPNGRTLASGGNDYTTMIWDTIQGVRTNTIPHRPRPANSIAFSPDGRTVASGAGDDSIVLIDTVTGVIRSITTETQVCSLTFSPDGSNLTSGHLDGLIRIWDVAAASQVRTPLPGHSSMVRGLSLSPDGRTLASAGEDKTVRVWDTLTAQELLCLTDCKARVNAVAFSPDGLTLAAADHTGAITLWRARPAQDSTHGEE
jgi:eukaryotic-like serine/threonine-protein kinase